MATQATGNTCVRGGKDRNHNTYSILSGRTRCRYVQGQLLSTRTFSWFSCQLADEYLGMRRHFCHIPCFPPLPALFPQSLQERVLLVLQYGLHVAIIWIRACCGAEIRPKVFPQRQLSPCYFPSTIIGAPILIWFHFPLPHPLNLYFRHHLSPCGWRISQQQNLTKTGGG